MKQNPFPLRFIPLRLPALMLAFASGLQGEEAPADPLRQPPLHPTVLVPFEGPSPASGAAPARYFVDYETFQLLWARAKAWRQSQEPADDSDASKGSEPRDTIINQALYRAHVSTDHIAVEGRLDLLVRGGTWSKVPLSFSKLDLSEILLDGVPASFQQGNLMVEKPGRHEVTVRFRVPFPADAAKAKWNIPGASAAALSITMEDPAMEPVLGTSEPLPLVESADPTSPGGRVFTAALGARQVVELRRQLKTAGRALAQPSLAAVEAKLFVTPAVERLEASWRLEFSGQEADRFAIAFDPTVVPLRFEIPHLASWQLVEGTGKNAGLRQLEFVLTRPVSGSLKVELVGERGVPSGAASAEPRRFPRLGATAARIEQRRTLFRAEDLKVVSKVGPLHRQAELVAADRQTPGFQAESSFLLAGADEDLEYVVSAREARRSVTADYVYQAGSGKLETICQFQLRSPDAALHGATVVLPPGSSLQNVNGNRLQDWWRTGDELFVRFSGDTPEVTALLVHVTTEVTTDAASLSLPSLSLREFPAEGVSGSALIVAHITQDCGLTLGGGQGRGIREVGAADVGQDFEVLAPLERKRGFRFDRGDFSASVSLATVPPGFNALWVMLAQAYDSWVKMSIHVDVELKKSAMDRVLFSTPDTVPEARITGEDVREVRSEVAGGQRRYTVIFQRFVGDATEFTVETELPHNGSANLPDVVFEAASRTERYVIVENQSADKLTTQPRALESTVMSLLPFKPSALGSAEIWRAPEGWGLGLSMEKLETSAGNEAVVLLGDLTTSLRSNGEVWHRAAYHLRNRSLQFLPVLLPPGAELVSVTVAGQSVRADQGLEEGRPVMLIPLIQTKPGQLAYDVVLIYRSREGVALDGRTVTARNLRLDDPELVGQTVERTLWHLYVPVGQRLVDWDGNVQSSDEDSLSVERIRSELNELQNLNWVGGSEVYDDSLRHLAVSNGSLLCAQVEEKLNTLRQKSASQRTSLGSQKGLVLESELVELEKKLGEQKTIAEGNKGRFDDNGDIKKHPEGGRAMTPGKDDAAAGGEYATKLKTTVTWDANSIAIQGRNLKIEQKEEQKLNKVESQVRLNDNLSVGNAFFGIEAAKGQKREQEVAQIAMPDQGKAEVAEAGQKAQIDKLEQRDNASVEGKLSRLGASQGQEFETLQEQARGIVPVARPSAAQTSQINGNRGTAETPQSEFTVPKPAGQPQEQFRASAAPRSEPTEVLGGGGASGSGQGQPVGQTAPVQQYTIIAGKTGGTLSYNNARSKVLSKKSLANPQEPDKNVDQKENAAPPVVAGTPVLPAPSEASPSKNGQRSGSNAITPGAIQADNDGTVALSVGGTLMTGGQPSLGALPQLQILGRRSVVVDFPLEGVAHHFFKLKDHAELVVETEEIPVKPTWPWILALVGSVLALLGLDRLVSRVRQFFARRHGAGQPA